MSTASALDHTARDHTALDHTRQDRALVLRAGTDSRPAAWSWTPVRLRVVSGASEHESAQHESAEPESAEHDQTQRDPTPEVARPQPHRVRRRLVSLPGGVRRVSGVADPQEWSAVLATAIAQVLAGRRPLHQLERWMSEAVLLELAGTLRQRRRRSAPDRLSEAPVVVSVRVQCPRPRVAEVAVRLQHGDGFVAMALRMEAREQRWLCTAVDLGPSGEFRPRAAAMPGSAGA